MKLTLTPIFFLIGLHWGAAQTVRVLDAQTGEPLPFVTVFNPDSGAHTSTDEAGEAGLANFKGAAAIEFRLLGYSPLRLSYFDLERNHFTVRMEAWAVSLDQVVVSASRWRQARREVPGKVLSVSPSGLEAGNPQTAADLLGSTGAVYIQKSQLGGGSPMIRGFAANRLLIAVDGVRMNNAIFRSGNLQNVISIDPFSLGSAEVFFGPGSVMYGSDAIGGVMSFSTLAPRFAEGKEKTVSGNTAARHASANGELTTHFSAAVGGEKWAALTSLTYNHFGHQRMGRHGPDDYLRPWYVDRINGQDVVRSNEDPLVQRPTGFDMTHLMQKVAFRPSGNWELSYGLHYAATTGYARYDRLIRTRNGLPRSAEWQYGPQTWRMNHLQADHHSNGKLFKEMSLHLAHQFFEESRIDRDFSSTRRSHRVEQVNAWSANLDFLLPLNGKTRLNYGFEAVLNDVNSNGTEEDLLTGNKSRGPSRYPQATWQSWGVYLSLQRPLAQKLRGQAGLRYSSFGINATFDTAFYPLSFSKAALNNGALTGSFGLVLFPSEKWTLSLNAATGYRSPNVDDMGKIFDSEPGAVVVPNPDLEAEYAYHLELGAAHIFGRYLKVDVAAFYTWLDDALVRRNFTLNGLDSIVYDGELSRVQAIQNAASARVYGFQLNAELKLPAGFGFHGNFNYQKGEEELSDGSSSPSRHAAPWFGALHGTYRSYGLLLDLNIRFSGERPYEDMPFEEKNKDYLYARDENGNPYAPGWYTLNFNARYQLNEKTSITAGVENLLDKRYRPYASGLTAPGRNVVMAVRVGF